MIRPLAPLAIGPLLASLCAAASAQSAAIWPGEHPAVTVHRLYAQRGYDYAAQFYPHPAWLYLAAEAPRPKADYPAVAARKRPQQEPQPTAAATGLRADQPR